MKGNAGFQPGGGISTGNHGYGAGYNTYGTNVYYGGGVGGGYGIMNILPSFFSERKLILFLFFPYFNLKEGMVAVMGANNS